MTCGWAAESTPALSAGEMNRVHFAAYATTLPETPRYGVRSTAKLNLAEQSFMAETS